VCLRDSLTHGEGLPSPLPLSQVSPASNVPCIGTCTMHAILARMTISPYISCGCSFYLNGGSGNADWHDTPTPHIISVYLVYGQVSTHIPCRQSCRPIVCSLALYTCNQDLRSTTCPGHGHATYDMSKEPVVCRACRHVLRQINIGCGSDVETKQN
jgi:hypothetical protein